MLWSLINKYKCFNVAGLNVLIDKYNWPPGCKPPHQTKEIAESTKCTCDKVVLATEHPQYRPPGSPPVTKCAKGHPQRDCKFVGSAAQVASFTAHSVELLLPTVRAKGGEHWPEWQCWRRHCEAFAVASQRQVWLRPDWNTPRTLQRLLAEHDHLFLRIREYVEHFKPKEHYKCHLPAHSIFFGPPKNFANWKNELMHRLFRLHAQSARFAWHCGVEISLATGWSERTALALWQGKHARVGATEALGEVLYQEKVERATVEQKHLLALLNSLGVDTIECVCWYPGVRYAGLPIKVGDEKCKTWLHLAELGEVGGEVGAERHLCKLDGILSVDGVEFYLAFSVYHGALKPSPDDMVPYATVAELNEPGFPMVAALSNLEVTMLWAGGSGLTVGGEPVVRFMLQTVHDY